MGFDDTDTTHRELEPLVTREAFNKSRSLRIKEFEFLRGDLFFGQILTFSLAVTGFQAIVRPDSLVERQEKFLFRGIEGLSLEGNSYLDLGGVILGGNVCGSVLEAFEVAQTVKTGREISRVAFEEDSFNDPHKAVTPSSDYRPDVGDYMKDVASVCIGAAYQSIKGSLPAKFGKILAWPSEVQYLRHLRNATSHGNEFTIINVEKGIQGIDPDRPPRWRTSVMPTVGLMAGKQLFNEFLRPGDIPVLLSDIRQLLSDKPYE